MIDNIAISNLIREITSIYNIRPYHNFTHGFGVFQVIKFCTVSYSVKIKH